MLLLARSYAAQICGIHWNGNLGGPPFRGNGILVYRNAPGNEVIERRYCVKATEANRVLRSWIANWYVRSAFHESSSGLRSGQVVLDRLGLKKEDRENTDRMVQVITRVGLIPGSIIESLPPWPLVRTGGDHVVVECAPAAYINYACNDVKKEPISRSCMSPCGSFWADVAFWYGI
jgi:hypothetical protein